MTGWVLRLLRVPAEPEAPDGSPESIRIFRAGTNYYRWRLAMWAIASFAGLAVAGFFVFVLIMALPKMPPVARALMLALAGTFLSFLAVVIPLTYFMQRLDYEQRWYIVTDRSLRIRNGIWSVAEITMTFANVQDLRITAGPVQGWLGLADLEVRSAGGGGEGKGESEFAHAAKFSGVDNAEEIRDLIGERLRRYRDAGLGEHGPALTVDAAAAELLAEARLLRGVVTR